MSVHSYKDLIAWQKSIDLVTRVYRCTKGFPKDEAYGLTSQVRRAAVSVPSNIAEGQGRLTTGEFRQFLGHARGSLHELQTQLVIARNLGYLSDAKTEELMECSVEVDRVVNGLLTALRG